MISIARTKAGIPNQPVGSFEVIPDANPHEETSDSISEQPSAQQELPPTAEDVFGTTVLTKPKKEETQIKSEDVFKTTRTSD